MKTLRRWTCAHVFTRSRPTATVETCACGAWRFTEHAGPSIVEIPVPMKGGE